MLPRQPPFEKVAKAVLRRCYNVPGLDGREVLQALRQMPAYADIPVVFFTAKAQHEELRALSALGVAGILCKPFDPMTLSDQVRDIWRSL